VLTARKQAEIYWQAQSAWYVTLICSQFWHIWVCKTRVVSCKRGALGTVALQQCA
jgi:hypothetical protein